MNNDNPQDIDNTPELNKNTPRIEDNAEKVPKVKKTVKRPYKANTEPFDPSKPLKNLKQEKFCRKVAVDPKKTQTQAYMEVYQTKSVNTAKANASESLARTNIRERVLFLMSQNAGEDILKKASRKLDNHLDSGKETISLEATKTVFKVAGVLDEQKYEEKSYNPTQINIVIRSSRETNKHNSNDVIEIRPD